MSGRQSGPSGAVRPVRSTARRPRLEALEPRELLATFVVSNVGDLIVGPGGNLIPQPGSLRDVIMQANANPGADIINFNIAGTGVKNIAIDGRVAFPFVTGSVTIDGTTQPGYSTFGTPQIFLNGANAGVNANGLVLSANSIVIKALGIQQFSNNGIRITGDNNVIQSSYIGVNANGTVAVPNGAAGIRIESSGNTIGGAAPGGTQGLGNLISGNSGNGITVAGFGTTGNIITGNQIGVNVFGTAALPNGGDGIGLIATSFATIGGVGDFERNIIAGNVDDQISLINVSNTRIQNNYIGTDVTAQIAIPGTPLSSAAISIFGASSSNLIGGSSIGQGNVIGGNQVGVELLGADNTIIQGNFIGTDPTGLVNLGNGGQGVRITSQGSNNVIGGDPTVPTAANLIAFNGAAPNGISTPSGVVIESGTRNTVLSNAIYSNSGLGIQLGNPIIPTPTPNDDGDLDIGANNLQNYPEIAVAGTAIGRTLVQGNLNSTPNSQFRVQIFSTPSSGAPTQALLATLDVTTDANGNAPINAVLDFATPLGSLITTTATDANGNTSEFSPAIAVVTAQTPDLDLQVATDVVVATVNNNLTYTLRVTNNSTTSPATNVLVTNTLPQSATLVSVQALGGTVQSLGQTIQVTYPTIGPGQSRTITIVVVPTEKGITITNVAQVQSADIDPDSTNNQVVTSTQVDEPIELSLDIKALPEVATVGSDLVYLVSVLNSGPGTASGVEINAVLPIDVFIQEAAVGQGRADIIGSTVRAQIGALAPGVPATLRLLVRPSLSGMTQISATASANEIEVTPDPNPNFGSLAIPVNPAADLNLTMVADAPIVSSPDLVTYTITVTNNGPDNATGVQVSDTLPAGLSIVDAVSSQGNPPTILGNSVIAILDTVPALSSATVTIRATPTGSAIVTNTAFVSLNESDLDTTNNQASVQTTLNPSDLAVAFNNPPTQGFAGRPLTFSFTVTNNGPSDATDVVAVADLPAGVILPPGGSDPITFNIGSLAAGASTTLEYTFTPTVSSTLFTSVSVTGLQIDTITANNAASTGALISPLDLSLEATGPTANVLVGDDAVFEFSVFNGGPSDATNAVVTIPLAGDFTFVSGTPGANVTTIVENNGNIVATVPILAVGATASFQVTVRPVATGTFNLGGTVQSDQVDTDTANNADAATVTVINLPGAAQFTATTFQTRDDAGFATITIRRTGGNLGDLTVRFDATAGTGAVAGVNFTPVSTNITFADGQSETTVTVPILDDNVVTPPKFVNLSLTDIGSGAVGTIANAVLNIAEGNFSETGPQVANLQALGSSAATAFVVTFNEPMDLVSASNPANYTLLGPLGSNQAVLPLASVVYDAQTNSVIITPAVQLNRDGTYSLTIEGSTLFGLSQVALDGNGTGQPGSDFVTLFTRGSRVTYTDVDGDTVKLSLSRGGIIDVFRAANGGAQLVRVSNGTSRTVISGSVRKARTGDGRANLGDLYGVGLFPGGVKSRLKTPPFTTKNQNTLAPARTTVGARTVNAALARRFHSIHRRYF